MGERHVDAAAVERTITVYGDLLYRIALHHLKTREDAEDVAHDVFIKWLEKAPAFSSDEHEKAWLIRTTINACTDFRRRAARRLTVALDACPEPPAPETGSVLEDVLALPPPSQYPDLSALLRGLQYPGDRGVAGQNRKLHTIPALPRPAEAQTGKGGICQ